MRMQKLIGCFQHQKKTILARSTLTDLGTDDELTQLNSYFVLYKVSSIQSLVTSNIRLSSKAYSSEPY